MAITYIGIGSNIGSKEQNCLQAIELLQQKRLKVLARSSLYQTSPIGYSDQDWFINCVIKAQTDLSPADLLTLLKSLEKAMGREEGPKWGPRLIDLDILLYDNLILEEGGLSIPHKHLTERLFVLEPLAEMEATLIHPGLGVSIWEFYRKVKSDESQKVNRLQDPTCENIKNCLAN